MASGDTKTEALMNALENGGDIDGIAGCCNTNLQNYIIDSIDSVLDAKNAIQNKGGTVDYNAGLTSLASEIETIPQGGGSDTWGTITYVDANNVEHTVEIQNEDEYLLLGNANNVDITIGGETFKIRNITKVDLGIRSSYAPTNFLFYCNNLTTITGVENLIYVEDNFLNGCSALDCELNFSELIHVGGSFLMNCTALNSSVTFPELRNISGSNFMYGCTSFAQPLTLHNNFTYAMAGAVTSFLYNCKNFTGPLVCNTSIIFASGTTSLSTNDSSATMYTTGITLTGTYASDWKAAFADRTSTPYRKLIVGS